MTLLTTPGASPSARSRWRVTALVAGPALVFLAGAVVTAMLVGWLTIMSALGHGHLSARDALPFWIAGGVFAAIAAGLSARALERWILVRHGVDVNAHGRSGETALMWARTPRVADVLIAHGGGRERPDAERRVGPATPVGVQSERRRGDDSRTRRPRLTRVRRNERIPLVRPLRGSGGGEIAKRNRGNRAAG